MGVLQSKTLNKLTHWTVGQVSSSLLTKHVNRHSSLRAGVQLKQQQLLLLSLKVASTEQSSSSGDINIFEDLPNTVTANTNTYLLLPAPTLAHLSVETVKQFLNRCE